LTRAGALPLPCSHEIPEQGISPPSAYSSAESGKTRELLGSSPPSDTQTSEISPNRAALEHAVVVLPRQGIHRPADSSPAPSTRVGERSLICKPADHACGRPVLLRCEVAAVTAQPLAPVIPSSGLSGARRHRSTAGRRPLPLARLVPCRPRLTRWSTGSAGSTHPGGSPTGPSSTRWAGKAVTGLR
jgi:hypothetical protein